MTNDAGPIRAIKLEILSNPAPPQPLAAGANSLISPVFLVDPSACILCDRCVCACDDVRENHVISRTGKGSMTRF
jgi:predicted molibdopterin-dependent oxidoreductase YjgC